jgi:hypothetical protein
MHQSERLLLSGNAPNPAEAGCNSKLAQYSDTPLLRAQAFEDEDDDEDEAPGVWSSSHEKSA